MRPVIVSAATLLTLIIAIFMETGPVQGADVSAVPRSEIDASPALAAIETDLESGALSLQDALLYRLYAVTDPSLLPEQYQLPAVAPIRCGTLIRLEIAEHLAEYSASQQQQIANLLARPTGLNSFVDTAHYRVHYTTTGTRVPYGWPDTAYLDAVVVAVENCWNFDHAINDWQVPPSDGTLGGGTNLIDLYIDDLGTSIYGYTEGESNPVDEWPSNRTAFFVIDNDYTGFGYSDRTLPMKVTVAHEYHHVVQMGYTIGNSWWMENMATWMEDETYDAIDDNYAYFPCFTSIPYKTLSTADGCHEYGTFIWPTWIGERYAHDEVRQIQHCAGTTNIFTCYDNAFAGLGTTFGAAFGEFWTWDFYTNIRDDGAHYIEGADYPSMVAYDRQFTSYPQTDQHPTGTRLPSALSTSVLRFRQETGSTDNLLSITFDGPTCTERVVVIQKLLSGAIFVEHYMDLDANGNGAVDIPDWNQTDYAHMFTILPRACGAGTFDYVIDADTSDQPVGVENPALYVRTIDLDQNAPNPFHRFTDIRYAIEAAGPVRVEVFDASGRLVRTLVDAVQDAGEFAVSWDSRDDAGVLVAPGVYFYRVGSGPVAESKKMVIVGD